ncbi:MAG: prepilin-type N-terminal cleavage/methylation domain-containing protein [Candidatus Ozemobacteraceae bacterium]
MRRRAVEYPAGFSMVELMLVLVVIGLGLIPILSTFSASHQNTRATLEEVIATNFASELIEAIQALPFDQVKLFPGDDLAVDASGNLNPDPFDLARAAGNNPGIIGKTLPSAFRIHLEISPFPAGATNSRLLKIALVIKWGGRNQEIKLLTLKGDAG